MTDAQICPTRVIAFTQAKGGVGATSICAAVGEACGVAGKTVLLWDLNVETKDLSRFVWGANLDTHQAKVVNDWIGGAEEISAQTMCNAVIPVALRASLLTPPDDMPQALKLVCTEEGKAVCQKVLEVARKTFDVVLVDIGKRIGPASEALLAGCDEVAVVTADSIEGYTGLDVFLGYLRSMITAENKISFILNRQTEELRLPESRPWAALIQQLGSRPWRLPAVPLDRNAAVLQQSVGTLFSLGSKETRTAIMGIAFELGLIDIPPPGNPDPSGGPSGGAAAFAGLAKDCRGRKGDQGQPNEQIERRKGREE